MKIPSISSAVQSLIIGLGLAFSSSASAVSVVFNSIYVGHGAVSSWNGSFSNATMNSRTDLLPCRFLLLRPRSQ